VLRAAMLKHIPLKERDWEAVESTAGLT
jgi:hypothetical protein